MYHNHLQHRHHLNLHRHHNLHMYHNHLQYRHHLNPHRHHNLHMHHKHLEWYHHLNPHRHHNLHMHLPHHKSHRRHYHLCNYYYNLSILRLDINKINQLLVDYNCKMLNHHILQFQFHHTNHHHQYHLNNSSCSHNTILDHLHYKSHTHQIPQHIHRFHRRLSLHLNQ